jgi:hypothetical protein
MKLHYSKVDKSILNIKTDKRSEVYNFGEDNAFPSLVEALLRVSVTARTCTNRVAKAIYGGAFGDAGKVVVNSKGQTLNEALRIASRQFARHSNAYLQIGFDLNYKIKSIVVVPSKYVRVGKSDDKGYSGL